MRAKQTGQAAIYSTAINGMLAWTKKTAVETGIAVALGDREGRLRRWVRENFPNLVEEARELLRTAQPGPDTEQLNQALALVRDEYQRG